MRNMRESCRLVVSSAVVLSLCVTILLPSGQVVAAGGVKFDESGHELALEHEPEFEPVVPPTALQYLMNQVVALQMQSVQAPDGQMYLILGAVLQVAAGDVGFQCAVILHQYTQPAGCAEVLDWPTE